MLQNSIASPGGFIVVPCTVKCVHEAFFFVSHGGYLDISGTQKTADAIHVRFLIHIYEESWMFCNYINSSRNFNKICVLEIKVFPSHEEPRIITSLSLVHCAMFRPCFGCRVLRHQRFGRAYGTAAFSERTALVSSEFLRHHGSRVARPIFSNFKFQQ